MRVASDVKSSESPDSGSGATPNVFGKSAGSTKKNAVLRYFGNCYQNRCIRYRGPGAGPEKSNRASRMFTNSKFGSIS
jgi:hypothetical protein